MAKLFKGFDYGTVPNSWDICKFIALITMVIDHLGYYIFPDQPWLRVVGRLAMPLFLFLVGYSQPQKFDWWLFIAAVIVLISQALNGVPMLPLNILFAILGWRVLLGWIEQHHPGTLNDTPILWIAFLIFHIPAMFLVEYGTIGLMFAVLGYYARIARHDRISQCTWLTTAAFWVAMQSVNFGFAPTHIMMLVIGAMMIVLGLARFSVTAVPLPQGHSEPSPTKTERLVILIARNTLLLYVLHVVALQTLGHHLHPDIFGTPFLFYR